MVWGRPWCQQDAFDRTQHQVHGHLGHRGRVAVFIDGNNLFHAARFHNIDIDYNKLLRILLGDGRLLRARIEDLTAALLFLDRAPSVTGQVIHIDAGEHLGPPLENHVRPEEPACQTEARFGPAHPG